MKSAIFASGCLCLWHHEQGLCYDTRVYYYASSTSVFLLFSGEECINWLWPKELKFKAEKHFCCMDVSQILKKSKNTTIQSLQVQIFAHCCCCCPLASFIGVLFKTVLFPSVGCWFVRKPMYIADVPVMSKSCFCSVLFQSYPLCPDCYNPHKAVFTGSFFSPTHCAPTATTTPRSTTCARAWGAMSAPTPPALTPFPRTACPSVWSVRGVFWSWIQHRHPSGRWRVTSEVWWWCVCVCVCVLFCDGLGGLSLGRGSSSEDVILCLISSFSCLLPDITVLVDGA